MKFGSSLSRSRSAQSLKLIDSGNQDDKMTILAQLFWLAVSLLESDYEHEFLLALRLLARVLHRLPLDRPDARDKVEKLQQQLKWAGYPGVHSLLLKGCTSPTTYESTIALLSQFAPLLKYDNFIYFLIYFRIRIVKEFLMVFYIVSRFVIQPKVVPSR